MATPIIVEYQGQKFPKYHGKKIKLVLLTMFFKMNQKTVHNRWVKAEKPDVVHDHMFEKVSIFSAAKVGPPAAGAVEKDRQRKVLDLIPSACEFEKEMVWGGNSPVYVQG